MPALAACSSVRVIEWTEDARLSDGRMIVVNRTQEYRGVTDPGAGFQSGYLFYRSTISAEMPPPIARRVSWEGSLIPMVLDILEDGNLVLVGYPGSGAGRKEWKLFERSDHYVALVMRSTWERIPFAEVPNSVHANLLGAARFLFVDGDMRSGSHVDLALKQRSIRILGWVRKSGTSSVPLRDSKH